MNDYEILIKKGYKYIKFKNIDKFNKYEYLTSGKWFDEDVDCTIKNKRHSNYNADDWLESSYASQIEEESKLNLDYVLEIMEKLDE